MQEGVTVRMKPRRMLLCLALGVGLTAEPARAQDGADASSRRPIRIVTLDPGHFHASLVHRESYAQVDDLVHVYAPLGLDLGDHLKRVARFNLRPTNPTRWNLEVHAGADFLDRMIRDKAGNVVVVSGRNRGKIDAVRASVAAGFHALVDKPWILRSEDLPKLRETLELARARGRVAYDMMTERFEITTVLQKELVNDREVFGQLAPGTEAQPAVYMESVHHLMKTVAGAPLVRPAWFFDTAQQGEGLNDIGTHLVDLVQWTLWPGQPLDVERDVRVLSAQRWPTPIAKADFRRVTGEAEFPAELLPRVQDDVLEYDCNTLVSYSVRGAHVKLNVIWDWEAPAGTGDTHFAVYRGSRARVEVRQGRAENHRPETYVVPNEPQAAPAVLDAVRKRLAALASTYPGVEAEQRGSEILIRIPDRLRTSHEDHFAEVARRFFGYVDDPATLPAWENANMLAKYYVTTRGTELSRLGPARPAARIAPR
jgi:predicted dehydrogenase